MVRIFVPTVPLTATQVWTYITRALTDKVGFQITEPWEPYLDMALSKAGQLTEQNTLKMLFFKRAETLGTDGGDAGYAITHNYHHSEWPLCTEIDTGNVASSHAGSAGYHGVARAGRMPSGGFGGKLVFEGRGRILETADCGFLIGLGYTGILAPGPEEAYFYYLASIGPNWRAASSHSGTEDTDTGVAADTNWHIFRIEVTTGKVDFFIDGTLVNTHTTQVPDAGLEHCADEVAVDVRTEVNAVKRGFYEYVALWIQGP